MSCRRELFADNFACGGGASTGIKWAIGRSPHYALNHNAEALAMHRANHPESIHLHSDIWEADPVEIGNGHPFGGAWFSPDCTFFAKARGGKPFRDVRAAKRRRGLAWAVTRWARAVHPRVIFLENVEEFEDWCPLLPDGTPDRARLGLTFRRWVGQLRSLGYEVEWHELRACDYGAPTSRKRLFLIARCDSAPIVWPEPTHGDLLWQQPHRTAAECMDWSIPCPSIFERSKPYAEPTLRRIARGIQRFVLGSADPFIIPLTHGGDARVYSIREPLRTITGANRGEFAFVAPTMVQTGYGERPGQTPRTLDLHKPLGTIVGGGAKHALVAAFLAKHYGGHEGPGSKLGSTISTITTRDHHALCAAFLTKFYGTCADGQRIDLPLPTVTATGQHFGEVRALLERFNGDDAAVVQINGDSYAIVDIGMRMLQPRELFRAQGFPDSYIIDPEYEGKPLLPHISICAVLVSVSPYPAAAIVSANYQEAA